jgi:hypothetical protein
MPASSSPRRCRISCCQVECNPRHQSVGRVPRHCYGGAPDGKAALGLDRQHRLGPWPSRSTDKAAYVAAKHGLIGLTNMSAWRPPASGVTSMAVCPGWVRTPLVEKQISDRRSTCCAILTHRSSQWRRSLATPAKRLRRGVQMIDRRNSNRLPATHALAAVSLQVRQSLWGSGTHGSLEIVVPTPTPPRRINGHEQQVSRVANTARRFDWRMRTSGGRAHREKCLERSGCPTPGSVTSFLFFVTAWRPLNPALRPEIKDE